jgi:2-desacetyl-2-hydroxyethyl bacteriochlorophyllide A dehydrogenase
MQAAVLTRFDAPFTVVERPVPVPGPGEVLVAVGACGVCGSDRFLQQGGFGGALPIVPGHEAAGTIAALGANVEGLEVGTRVAIYYLAHCGVCRYCREGRENICVEVRRMGVEFDGAMADYVVVPAENCLPLDPGFDLAAAAVITDAIGTPTHALRQSRIKGGDTVLVMGIGGIGTNAVQIAKLMGATVIAVSRSDAALANGGALGADFMLKSDATLAAAVEDVTRGLGVDAVIQCAPGEAAYNAALLCLGRGGRLVIVGTSKTPIPVETNHMLWKEQELIGSRGFTRADIRQGLDWYARGQIRVDHLVAHRRPLSQINEAIADLDNPDVVRTVIEFAYH